MAASIYFTGCLLLLQLRVITSTEDEQQTPSCSLYLNQSYLESLTPEIQKKICDNLLRDLSPVTGPEQTRNNNKPSQYEVWGYGVMMVTFIRWVGCSTHSLLRSVSNNDEISSV